MAKHREDLIQLNIFGPELKSEINAEVVVLCCLIPDKQGKKVLGFFETRVTCKKERTESYRRSRMILNLNTSSK